MLPRGSQLYALLVVAATARLATARPGDNDLLSDTQIKTIELPAIKSATDTKSVTTEPATTETPESDGSDELYKAVNEQYPSALLFGGTCGGTIISDKWVLTAGHCTLFSGGQYVLAGTNNTANGRGIYRNVKRLVIHPLFTVGPYWLNADEFHIKQVAAHWDFLLAELDDPLPLDGRTMVAATLNDETDLKPGLEVDYAGFGTDHHGGTMRSEMHGMQLAVEPDSVCKNAMEQYTAEDMLCTKGRPPKFDSACNGDSGSGLVDKSGRLVGVASWVQNDAHECKNGALVVFSRVSAVRDWIRQVTSL